ncbi:ATP-binding protein [Kitasatospora sp. RB6PN24]|uniref:ATP-binding protein n=1 Tax=Kitasatospora humi TaxID=2893891 RepID=UPI001E49F466|nr:ATP-binding protein [Kitasatospora humi]MCC9306729.1 ATP-binding protein [Kitasatospora humi]
MQVVQEQLAVAADPAEVGRARRWVRGRLLDLGADPAAGYAETLVLLVSELVTNAVVHAGSPAVLRLVWSRDEGPVRVEVADASGTAPQPRHACPGATSGRGLELVELLAARWGWCPKAGGKLVWCEVDRTDLVDGTAPREPAPLLLDRPLDRVQTADSRSSQGRNGSQPFRISDEPLT